MNKTSGKKISFYINESVGNNIKEIAQRQGRTDSELYREAITDLIKKHYFWITDYQKK